MATPLYNHYTELNKDVLMQDQDFLNDAAQFLIDREGYEAADLEESEQVYDAFMEHFRYQNVNEVTALRDLTYAQEADDEAKARFGRLMDTYDKMDSDLGLEAAGDYLGGVFTAPSTYAGIFSFGAGKAGALAAQQGIKFGIRQALKTGALRGGATGATIDAVTAGGTVAAQEATRVETGVKEEIDMTQVGLATVIGGTAGGILGTATGARKAKVAFEGESIAMGTRKLMDDATEEAHKGITKDVFFDKNLRPTAGKFADTLFDDAEAAQEAAGKVPLKRTIPEDLAKGKVIRGEFGELEVKEIENIAAAAARIDHLIPDLPDLPVGKTERFASRFSRAITGGMIESEDLGRILRDHNITVEQLGPLFAAELSRAGSILGTFGAGVKELTKKQAYKENVKAMNQLDDALREFGDITNVARKKLDEEMGKGYTSKIGNFISHVNKARIGFMTIQPATTVRNTTNGYMRNYVYMMDNFGAGMANYAKGSIKKLMNPTDEMVKQEAERATKMGVAQLRTGVQSLFFQDLLFGMQSVKTNALFQIMRDPKFGQSKTVQRLLREMGDVGNMTGAEGGLIGVSRTLNGLNTMSDNMFKRAIFSRELDKAIRANPIKIPQKGGETLTIDSLDTALKTGNFRAISDKEFASAMEEAFDFTYQTGNFRGREGGFNVAADVFIRFGQSTAGSTVVPFPRYLVNQLRFAYEHAPILGMINTFGILNKPGKAGTKGIVDLSPEQMGKQLGGMAILGTFLGLRANFGDETTGPYEYKDPTSNDLLDAKASIGPFSSYAMLADILYRYNPMNWHENDKVSKTMPFTSREMLEALAGGNIRAGTSLDILDGTVEVLTNGIDANSSELEIQDNLAKYFGNIANTFTVGAGALKDIFAQLDPQYRQLADNTDVNMWEYFLKQAGRSIPTTVSEDRPRLESPTRTTGIRRVNPIIKQITGLSPVEERTMVEEELKRLQFDYTELSPYRIKFDKPLSNEARGLMGQFMDREIRSFITSDDYLLLPNDLEKRKRLKQEINDFRTIARNMVLNPERATTKAEFNRIRRAKYMQLPPSDKRILEERYKTTFPDLYEDGILADGAFWMVDY
jgi:hypothetical protein